MGLGSNIFVHWLHASSLVSHAQIAEHFVVRVDSDEYLFSRLPAELYRRIEKYSSLPNTCFRDPRSGWNRNRVEEIDEWSSLCLGTYPTGRNQAWDISFSEAILERWPERWLKYPRFRFCRVGTEKSSVRTIQARIEIYCSKRYSELYHNSVSSKLASFPEVKRSVCQRAECWLPRCYSREILLHFSNPRQVHRIFRCRNWSKRTSVRFLRIWFTSFNWSNSAVKRGIHGLLVNPWTMILNQRELLYLDLVIDLSLSLYCRSSEFVKVSRVNSREFVSITDGSWGNTRAALSNSSLLSKQPISWRGRCWRYYSILDPLSVINEHSHETLNAENDDVNIE